MSMYKNPATTLFSSCLKAQLRDPSLRSSLMLELPSSLSYLHALSRAKLAQVLGVRQVPEASSVLRVGPVPEILEE